MSLDPSPRHTRNRKKKKPKTITAQEVFITEENFRSGKVNEAEEHAATFYHMENNMVIEDGVAVEDSGRGIRIGGNKV